MAATTLFSILIFLLSIATEPSSCEMNGSVALHNENLTNIARRPSNGTSYRCTRYIYQVEQELKSVIPPLDSLTDNYHSIYNALYPSNNLPSLYVKVTLQFLLDYNNGTKIIDKSMTKKMTWSESCAFVSVDHIGLDAVSFFSLGTILPQRRQAELTLTLSPVCKDTKLQNNKNLWRDVLSKLQDIAVIANVSDPRLNTVQCVVYGQEDSKTIENPFPSGIRTVLIWNYYWWILGTSLFSSIAIWLYLNNLIYDYYSPKNNQNNDKKLIIGVTFKMMWFISVLTFASLLMNFLFPRFFKLISYRGANILISILFLIIGIFYNIIVIYCECRSYKEYDPCECCKCRDVNVHVMYAFAFLFPNVYQVVHHFIWVLCGIILEPYWATPIFLLEVLVAFSLVYVVYLYQRDVVEKKKKYDCCRNFGIIFHLLLFLISFWAMLFVTAVVGHGHIVNVAAAGVIEVIATAIFIWMVKKAGLKLPVYKEKGNN